jgi:hypothetical protein
LVERLVWDQKVAGSNPVSLIEKLNGRGYTIRGLSCFSVINVSD